MTTPHEYYPQQGPPAAYPPLRNTEGEINLLDLWRVLVREKWLIILLTLLCTSGAVYKAYTAIPIYRAEVLMTSASEGGNKGGGLMAQYGGLAAMAGINLGGGDSTKETAVAKLQSRVFIEEFLKDEKLMPVLFQKSWDPETNNWKEKDPKNQPTMWDGVKVFKGILSVTEEKKGALITLSVEWKDPEKTSLWANLLVERINRYLRDLAVQESKRSMEYLKNELASSDTVELKQAVANLLEGQVKKIMLANVQTEFAFKVIDPAVVPPKNSFVKPKRRLMVVIGFVLGGFLGIFAAFFRNFLRQQKQQNTPPKETGPKHPSSEDHATSLVKAEPFGF